MEQITLKKLVKKALLEDIAWGDITTALTIPEGSVSTAILLAKSDAVVCGTQAFLLAFKMLDKEIKAEVFKNEGEQTSKGDIVLKITGKTRAILTAERTALNIFCHMSGIATLTRQVASKIAGTGCKVADTRKTLPLLRAIEKYAVKIGGGVNHRMDLSSSILIKDNHIKAAGGIANAVRLAKNGAPHVMKIEVEATSLAEAKEAINSSVDIILLDNMTPTQIREVIQVVPKGVILEASGNITLDNCQDYANTGIHIISMGSLTHSAKYADFSLEIS